MILIELKCTGYKMSIPSIHNMFIFEACQIVDLKFQNKVSTIVIRHYNFTQSFESLIRFLIFLKDVSHQVCIKG